MIIHIPPALPNLQRGRFVDRDMFMRYVGGGVGHSKNGAVHTNNRENGTRDGSEENSMIDEENDSESGSHDENTEADEDDVEETNGEEDDDESEEGDRDDVLGDDAGYESL